MKPESGELTLAAFGTKRIADMSRDDLIDALNRMHRSYMAIARINMGAAEVPVFHEDMDVWNDKLAEWFNDPAT